MRTEWVGGPWSDGPVRVAWEALADAAAVPNAFYAPWMIEAALDLPEAADLRVLLIWDERPGEDAMLIGALPLQVRRIFGGRIGIALQNWEQRVRALGEPLILPGFETAFWHAALTTLDGMRGGGAYLRLSGLIADSASTSALTALLSARGRRCTRTRSVDRALLRGGISADTYKATHIRKKVLKEHRRLRNRLADLGAVTIDRLAPDADAGPWIDDLFRLESSGWKGRDGVAAASDPKAEACFRAILLNAHRRRRLDFSRLALDGRAISMLATIEAGDADGFALKTAYDEDYAGFSPGVLLEMAYLDHALDVRGLVSVDSCARPGHPMIDRIWVDRRTIVSLAIPFDRIGSRLVCAAMAGARHLRDRRRRRHPMLTADA